MIGKIVPVGDGRSQLLPSFWLLNGACVCFSERGTKKCWNVDLRERNGRGDSLYAERAGGLRNACALVEPPKHLWVLGSQKGRKQGSVGLLSSLVQLLGAWSCDQLTRSGSQPSLIFSSHQMKPKWFSFLPASCSSRWVPLHLSTIYLSINLSLTYHLSSTYLLSICLYPTYKLLWNISLLSRVFILNLNVCLSLVIGP